MILTNKHNIPKVLYDKIFEDIHTDPYDRDGLEVVERTFRTTEMLGSPLPATLFARYLHDDKLIIDASHYLTLQFGTAFHAICEGVSTKDLMYEHKVSKILRIDGKTYCINGTIDELENTEKCLLLTDNKTCLISNLGYDKSDYHKQINVYRFLFTNEFPYGSNIKLAIRYFIKDLTASYKFKAINRAAPNSPAYQKALKLPNCSIYYEIVPEFPENHVADLITWQIQDHINNPDRTCNFEERWDVNDSFAVMLAGNKKARRVLPTPVAAENFIQKDLKPKDQVRASVVKRVPADWEKDKKCQYYCGVVSVCPYAQSKGYK